MQLRVQHGAAYLLCDGGVLDVYLVDTVGLLHQEALQVRPETRARRSACNDGGV